MSDPFDLAIVGGGIFGAATARDAALRGLRAILLEKGDLASASSSASSKLVHGGLRYLEHFQFRLVRESLAEQEILLRTAPHLVRRRPFLVPDETRARRPGWYVALGLRLYDILARRPSAFRSQRLSAAQVRLLEPGLDLPRLRGASLYLDAQVDDARLTLENLLDARSAGAEVRLHSEVTGLARDGQGWRVSAREGPNVPESAFHARCVVNTAGPWVDGVRRLAGRTGPPLVTWSRGAHLLVPAISRRHAFLLTARSDGRVFFILPQGDNSLVGTTEGPHAGSLEDLFPLEEELRYLWNELASRWPHRFRNPREVRGVYAGVRALAHTERALGSAPRDEQIADEDGLISVAGGKYTTHRAIAERVVNAVELRLGRGPTPCATRHRLLPGGAWGSRAEAVERTEEWLRVLREEGQARDWGERVARRLGARYGSRVPEVLGLAREFPDRAELEGDTILRIEVVHSIRAEWARHLDDVLFRRLGYWRDRGAARRAIDPVSRWMAAALEWSEARRAAEVDRVEERLRREEEALERLARKEGA